VVGGFVEHQQGRRSHARHHAGQGRAKPFTARQRAYRPVRRRVAEQKPRQGGVRIIGRSFRVQPSPGLDHRLLRAQQCSVLIHQDGLDRASYPSVRGRQISGDQLQQGRLARPIAAGDGDPLWSGDAQRKRADHPAAVRRLPSGVAQLQYRAAGAQAGRGHGDRQGAHPFNAFSRLGQRPIGLGRLAVRRPMLARA